MKKVHLIYLSVIAILFTALLYLLYLNFYKSQPTSAPTTGVIPTESADPTADWETYNSSDFGFSINYPQDLLIQDFINDQYNRTVSFKGSDVNFTISLRKADSNFNLDKYYFMDSPITRTTTLSDQKANVYELPNGYCDGPGCSQPYIAIVTQHNNDIYSVSFFGDSNLSSLESQILSTFKFLENNTNISGWNTYTSKDLNLSFNYPSSWHLYESGERQGHFVTLNNKKCENADPNCVEESEMGGSCLPSPDCEVLGIYLRSDVKTVQELFNQNEYYKDISKITLSGFPAYKSIYTWLHSEGSGTPTIDVQIGEKVYEISYINENTESETQKIISTIRF